MLRLRIPAELPPTLLRVQELSFMVISLSESGSTHEILQPRFVPEESSREQVEDLRGPIRDI